MEELRICDVVQILVVQITRHQKNSLVCAQTSASMARFVYIDKLIRVLHYYIPMYPDGRSG